MMNKGMRKFVFPLFLLGLMAAGNEAVAAERVSLGRISIEAPRGWELSGDGKRIIGRPAAAEKTTSEKWYALGSEFFVMIGPEADSGGDLRAALNRFMENTFIGYAEIELKSFTMKIAGGIENLGYSGSIRNRSSGDVIYAVVLVIRHKGERYFFVYDIDREDRFQEFSKGALVAIIDSLKFSESSAGGGKR